MEDKIKELIDAAEHIVVVQADNPDGDSLATSLALEEILELLQKKVSLYCGVEIPSYLRYLNGWDRVRGELPTNFDLSIIVDASAIILFEQLEKSKSMSWLKSKPSIIIDHHTASQPTIDFADVTYVKPAVAAGELVYELSNKFGWKRGQNANEMIVTAIMSDSLGLTSEATSARSIHIIGELVEQGVSLPKLENNRRAMQKKSPNLLKYKGQLLERVEYSEDNRVAHIHIPWEEIERYSPEYNPSMLVLDEMRMVHNVAIAVAFKTYPDGRITAKLRANYGFGIAADVAKQFGGGGHTYAAGFKVTDGRPFNQVKSECIRTCQQLLDTLKKDVEDETTQYAYSIG